MLSKQLLQRKVGKVNVLFGRFLLIEEGLQEYLFIY